MGRQTEAADERERIRLDKWLWAARFFKTRALAREAIDSGKVHCRGERCKPSREPKVGDELQIRCGFDERVVIVQALSAVRNDYSLARLYAMGADAWSLANHFTQMRQTPGFELNGNTGDLTANQDCVINRKLSWLKYQQGKIVPAS